MIISQKLVIDEFIKKKLGLQINFLSAINTKLISLDNFIISAMLRNAMKKDVVFVPISILLTE